MSVEKRRETKAAAQEKSPEEQLRFMLRMAREAAKRDVGAARGIPIEPKDAAWKDVGAAFKKWSQRQGLNLAAVDPEVGDISDAWLGLMSYVLLGEALVRIQTDALRAARAFLTANQTRNPVQCRKQFDEYRGWWARTAGYYPYDEESEFLTPGARYHEAATATARAGRLCTDETDRFGSPGTIDVSTLRRVPKEMTETLLAELRAILASPRLPDRAEEVVGRALGLREGYAKLTADPETIELLRQYPDDVALSWRLNAVDGAVEVLNWPGQGGPYGGGIEEKLTCHCSDSDEWPDSFAFERLDKILALLRAGLVGDVEDKIEGWLNQNSEPNRIRVLTRAPIPPVGDRSGLDLYLGNSDYFTMETIKHLADQGRLSGGPFVFDWPPGNFPFPSDCIPYHVSVQAILMSHDEASGKEFLILGRNNSRGSTPVYGWNATMAEQMQAPDALPSHQAWWQGVAQQAGASRPAQEHRHGDSSLADALYRGLAEEFALERTDIVQGSPVILAACLEPGMYFVTFIFLVHARLAPSTIHSNWLDIAEDRSEFDYLAAYPLVGSNREKAQALARLAQTREVDFLGQYILPKGVDRPLPGQWHPTSRMRILLLARHLFPREAHRWFKVEVPDL